VWVVGIELDTDVLLREIDFVLGRRPTDKNGHRAE